MAIALTSDASTFRRAANLPSASAFTLCGWFKFDTVTPARFWGPMAIMNAVDGVAGRTISSTSSGSAQLSLEYTNAGGSFVTDALLTTTAGVWYFIALTGAGTAIGNLIAYIRTLQDKSFTSVSNSVACNALTPGAVDFGREGFTGEFMDGAAQHLCMFDRALSSRDLLLLSEALLREQMPDKTGLNVYYRLRGATDYFDLSPNRRDATVTLGINKQGLRIWPRSAPMVAFSSGGSVYNVSLAESGTAADAVASALAAVAAMTEAGSSADVVSSTWSGTSAISESGTAADAPSAALVVTASISESGAAADAISSALVAVAAVAESGTAADQVSSIATLIAVLTEAGSAADSIDGSTGAATYNVSLAEAGSGTDSVNALVIALASISEAGSASDALSGQVVAIAVISEALVAADSIASAATLIAQLIEAGTAIDFYTTGALFQSATTRNVIAQRRYGDQSVGERGTVEASAPRDVEAPGIQVVIVTSGSRTVH